MHLTRLPKLQTLGLRDPQYASAPVTRLFNYLVFVLYHLPQLTRLDSYNVASKQLKDFAEVLAKNCSNEHSLAYHRSCCVRLLDILIPRTDARAIRAFFSLQTSITRKRMFYRMRVNTLRRQLHERLLQLNALQTALLRTPLERLRLLHCHTRQVNTKHLQVFSLRLDRSMEIAPKCEPISLRCCNRSILLVVVLCSSSVASTASRRTP